MFMGFYKPKTKIGEWCFMTATVMFALHAVAMFTGFGQSMTVWLLIILLLGIGFVVETSTVPQKTGRR